MLYDLQCLVCVFLWLQCVAHCSMKILETPENLCCARDKLETYETH